MLHRIKILLYYITSILLGICISFIININLDLTKRISSIIGWSYFSSWSISYYPQIFLNYKIKNVDGISLDYLYYCLFDSLTYSLYNIFFYYNKTIQDEYKKYFGHPNLVKLNDIIFSLHGLIITLITIL